MIEILPKSSEKASEQSSDVCHIYCRNTYPKDGRYISFCGMDITGLVEVDENHKCMDCTMCIYDMDIDNPCPVCGCWTC